MINEITLFLKVQFFYNEISHFINISISQSTVFLRHNFAKYRFRWDFAKYQISQNIISPTLHMSTPLSNSLSVATRTCNKGPFMTHALWEFLRIMSATKIKIFVVAPVACDLTKTSHYLTSYSYKNSHKEVGFYRRVPLNSLRGGVLIEL